MRIGRKVILAIMVLTLVIPAFSLMVGSGTVVKAGESIDVTSAEYGAVPNDGNDDTAAINKAISDCKKNGGGTVVLPAGTYNIDAAKDLLLGGGRGRGIICENGVDLEMTGATLKVSGNKYDSYQVISVRAVSNVNIHGGTIAGERKSHKGKSGEDGHGVCIWDSNNVKISGMTIKDNWGDGIYIGSQNDDYYKGCKGVTIENCTISNNRRNNISITRGSNITIDKCKIKKANGIAPQAGIDIEPNGVGGKIPKNRICKNITIKNTEITVKKKDNNHFAFVTISYAGNSKKVTSCQNVKIINCNLKGNVGNYTGKKVTIQNTKIAGTFYDMRNTKLKKTTYKGLWKW